MTLIVNPKTGKKINLNGPTHILLMEKGILDAKGKKIEHTVCCPLASKLKVKKSLPSQPRYTPPSIPKPQVPQPMSLPITPNIRPVLNNTEMDILYDFLNKTFNICIKYKLAYKTVSDTSMEMTYGEHITLEHASDYLRERVPILHGYTYIDLYKMYYPDKLNEFIKLATPISTLPEPIKLPELKFSLTYTEPQSDSSQPEKDNKIINANIKFMPSDISETPHLSRLRWQVVCSESIYCSNQQAELTGALIDIRNRLRPDSFIGILLRRNDLNVLELIEMLKFESLVTR